MDKDDWGRAPVLREVPLASPGSYTEIELRWLDGSHVWVLHFQFRWAGPR
jgi:hypothetical protein